MDTVVDLVYGQLKCSELNQEFNLQLDLPGKHLHDGTNFDTPFITVPNIIPSNVLPLFLSLQYNSPDGIITPVSQCTYSNNLVVTDNSSQVCIFRDLVYLQPTQNSSE